MAISSNFTDVEREIVNSVRLDDAWGLIEEFSGLVRESGTDQELQAVHAITARLDGWGIRNTVHEPELWISLPGHASLQVGDRAYPAKTPAMAAPTGPAGLSGPIAYLPSQFATSVNDIFSSAQLEGDVAGRIVVTEGLPMPGKIAELESKGAIGVVCIAPGQRIHEGICTSIWGAPDLTTCGRQPRVPVVSLSNADGRELVAQIGDGAHAAAEATLHAELETRWRTIPVVVAEIRGTVEPERFVLLHGHLDSWHEGVGDNATGDATLLEVARVLQEHRAHMARSVRICWWSGHSHGRYAGSTWYADAFANDLARNCIAHINCDSPGCRDATEYTDVYWMAEAAALATGAIHDFTGLPAEGRAPTRAGDISFSNLGVSTFLMLSSTMPEALRQERGLYAVGGCGGNIEWHTEADTMEVADRQNLLRDMRLYAGAAFRTANVPVHPLDFRATLDQIDDALRDYLAQAAGLADLTRVTAQVAATRTALEELYAAPEPATVEAARPRNDAVLAIGRALVSVLYTAQGTYRQDPALEQPPLPGFANALAARGREPDGVVRTELTRAANRLEGALLAAQDAALAFGR
ncbi:MAG: M28 family peptidase [Candidatus Dormiibacterota bacterium]